MDWIARLLQLVSHGNEKTVRGASWNDSKSHKLEEFLTVRPTHYTVNDFVNQAVARDRYDALVLARSKRSDNFLGVVPPLSLHDLQLDVAGTIKYLPRLLKNGWSLPVSTERVDDDEDFHNVGHFWAQHIRTCSHVRENAVP